MNWISDTFRGMFTKVKSAINYLKFWNVSPVFNDYKGDKEKLQAIFSNPALLKVFSLQCELFSLAKIYVYKDGKVIEDDPILNLISNPNRLQSKSQWLWDYMFWNMVGNDYLYIDSNLAERASGNSMYFLDHRKIEWPVSIENRKDKLIFSNSTVNDINKEQITYRYEDGTSVKFPLSKIVIINDLTNGVGNWFKGQSRIDALYKIINNSERSLDSKNINTRYAGKFIISGQSDPNNVSQLPMAEDEKTDVETKINGEKDVHAMKSMIDIKRFVDNLKQLGFDESFLADYFFIGTMYGIPKDVLESHLKSATFENQEKATARHVDYTLEPKGKILGEALAKHFGYDKEGKEIVFSWDHLPFTQIFEKDRSDIQHKKSLTMFQLLKNGVSLEEINVFLDTSFKTGGISNEAKN